MHAHLDLRERKNMGLSRNEKAKKPLRPIWDWWAAGCWTGHARRASCSGDVLHGFVLLHLYVVICWASSCWAFLSLFPRNRSLSLQKSAILITMIVVVKMVHDSDDEDVFYDAPSGFDHSFKRIGLSECAWACCDIVLFVRCLEIVHNEGEGANFLKVFEGTEIVTEILTRHYFLIR